MATARDNFVIGYVPGVTRATGILTTGGKDLLRSWLVKFARKWGKPGGEEMALKHPEGLAFMLTQHNRATILMFVDGTLVMYGRYPKPQLPAQVIQVLIDAGVTSRTPVTWYRDPENDESVEEEVAGNLLVGMPRQDTDLTVAPPPATAFESARKIVDELLGS